MNFAVVALEQMLREANVREANARVEILALKAQIEELAPQRRKKPAKGSKE